jgi:hypothetical protein
MPNFTLTLGFIRIMYRIVLIIISTYLLSCDSNQSSENRAEIDNPSVQIRLTHTDFALLANSSISKDLGLNLNRITVLPSERSCNSLIPEGDQAIINLKELIVIDRLLANAIDDNEISDYSLSDYYLQFCPVITPNGHKIVYVNALCFVPNESTWMFEEIAFDDGGSCFFYVFINLNSMRYYSFSANGVG